MSPDYSGRFEIHPLAKELSLSQLLAAQGIFTMRLVLEPLVVGGVPAVRLLPDFTLFVVAFGGFSASLSIARGVLCLKRGSYELELSIPPVLQAVELRIEWWAEGLQAYAQSDAVPHVPVGSLVRHPPQLMPPRALEWARAEVLARTMAYPSAQDFRRRILDALRQLEWKLTDSSAASVFWQSVRSADGRKPIAEPEAMSLVRVMLHDAAFQGGFSLTAEPRAGHGNLDLLAEAPLEGGGMARICIEAKKAEATDVEHGLTHQLPHYMQSKGADFGIFLVLWFKSDQYPHPRESWEELQTRLMALRPIKEQMSVEVLKLGLPRAPSKPPAS